MDDEAIVALYWNRDEAAITETDRKYGPYCRSIARNILSNREDAEECVSDTWRHAWNAMPPQRPGSLTICSSSGTTSKTSNGSERNHTAKRGSAGNQTIFHCAPAYFMIQYFI